MHEIEVSSSGASEIGWKKGIGREKTSRFVDN